jgi:hypothetical protein
MSLCWALTRPRCDGRTGVSWPHDLRELGYTICVNLAYDLLRTH